jgi:hypothetical protein
MCCWRTDVQQMAICWKTAGAHEQQQQQQHQHLHVLSVVMHSSQQWCLFDA